MAAQPRVRAGGYIFAALSNFSQKGTAPPPIFAMSPRPY